MQSDPSTHVTVVVATVRLDVGHGRPKDYTVEQARDLRANLDIAIFIATGGLTR